MATPDRFVDVALAESGYTENPPGSNKTKYADEVGHVPRQPWCASFVVWCARKAGVPLPSESAYTPSMGQAFRTAGQWVYPKDIRRGDVVFFDFPDSKRRIQHVGIALGAPAGGRVECVEGNTSAGERGSQDNGGGVFRRRRPLSMVVGAGRPLFGEEPEMDKQERDTLNATRMLAQGALEEAKRASAKADAILAELKKLTAKK